MTYFTSFLLKFPESRSISLWRQWDAVQFEVLLGVDNSLVSLLGLGIFAWKLRHGKKEKRG